MVGFAPINVFLLLLALELMGESEIFENNSIIILQNDIGGSNISIDNISCPKFKHEFQ